MSEPSATNTPERDAVVAQHIRNADLEIARVLRRFGAVGGLIAARAELKQALENLEVRKP